MHYKWNLQAFPPHSQEAAERLAKGLGISPILSRLLLSRHINSVEEARDFFRPPISALHDPFLFADMRKAVDRLNGAMGRKEKIMIYGDYDVDGCTAVALVYTFLSQFYSNIEYHVPNRYEEGYGISMEAVDHAFQSGVKLFIVLDCGIKAVREIAYAREKGIDFIICDHHMPDPVLPPACAILNAKRKGEPYPYPHLCGCGVGFKLMQAFAADNGIPFSRLVPLLDLCAVSIAADIVPVTGENRVLAYYGLNRLNTAPCTGLSALIDVCGLAGRDRTMSDIIFKIGPRINASGRMQNGIEAVDLLVEKDAAKAYTIARRINQYNEKRKSLDKSMTEQAERMVGSHSNADSHSIVIYNQDWHKGVVGIVASRLTELHYRPTVVLTRCGDFAAGSARSIPGFNIYKAVESCRDLLVSFGGHTYAAGLTMKADDVPEFRRRFNLYVKSHLRHIPSIPTLHIDELIDFKDITHKFLNDLKRFAPFGPENQKPVFCTMNVYDYGTSKVVGHEQEHIKLELVDNKSNNVLGGIAFEQSAQLKLIKTKHSFDICYTIQENTHKPGEPQLQIIDIRPHNIRSCTTSTATY